jgi:phenylalanyl-tRNA synthetase beta chain
LHEVRPLPFASQEDLDLFDDEGAIPIANPLRAEEGFLRTRLTSGLIHAVARNRDRGVSRVAIFEVGVTFRMRAPFEEIPKAGWALSGPADEGWSGTGRELDVFDAKGVLETVLADLRVTDWSLGPPPPGPFHPTRSAQVLIAGSPAGLIGELHPSRAAALGIEGRLAVGVIGLRRALEARSDRFELREVPRFPPVRRDLAFIVPESVAAGDVGETIRARGGELLADCLLFDVFRGGQLPDGHKSLAFALAFRAPDRTLTDEEVQPVVDAIATAVAEGSGGQLRAG